MNILNQLSAFPQVRAYVEARSRFFDTVDGDISVALETLGHYQLDARKASSGACWVEVLTRDLPKSSAATLIGKRERRHHWRRILRQC